MCAYDRDIVRAHAKQTETNKKKEYIFACITFTTLKCMKTLMSFEQSNFSCIPCDYQYRRYISNKISSVCLLSLFNNVSFLFYFSSFVLIVKVVLNFTRQDNNFLVF